MYSTKAVAELLGLPEIENTYRYCVAEKWAGVEVGKALESEVGADGCVWSRRLF